MARRTYTPRPRHMRRSLYSTARAHASAPRCKFSLYCSGQAILFPTSQNFSKVGNRRGREARSNLPLLALGAAPRAACSALAAPALPRGPSGQAAPLSHSTSRQAASLPRRGAAAHINQPRYVAQKPRFYIQKRREACGAPARAATKKAPRRRRQKCPGCARLAHWRKLKPRPMHGQLLQKREEAPTSVP